MLFKTTKKDPLILIMKDSLISLPAPMNISALWNFGSLLGLCLFIQLTTGILLSMHYINTAESAFFSVIEMTRNVNFGWLLRLVHANGASMFFICLYVHIARGMYYGSYRYKHTWMVGVTILLLTMATAFLGYVLPWGQMSFWGATVITNLLSTIPYIGVDLVYWLWGGFSVGTPTLMRFFSFHFLLPFIIAMLFIIHIMYLHSTGSNNPLGLMSDQVKIMFHPYFTSKDLVGLMISIMIFSILVFFYPFLLSDPDNFIMANPCVTPPHIQPEWYYLFPYAILRSIPSKLGGVVALFLSIGILYTLPFMPLKKYRSNQFYPLNQVIFWTFVTTLVLLTWIGAQPVQDPFISAGRILTSLYFLFYFIDPLASKAWEKFSQ